MYTHVLSLLIKTLSIVQKLYVRCDALKVIWFIIIADNIFISSNPCFYDMLCLRLSFRFQVSDQSRCNMHKIFYLVTSHMQFLNNEQPFIHKSNAWVNTEYLI